MSWARVQVVVRLHVVVSPERDEGGGFSVSFVSFAKFRKVSGRAAAGRPSGGVGPANGLCEAIIMAGARECVRCARSAGQEAGLMRAARRLCSSRLRVRVSGLGVCASRRVRAVWVRSGCGSACEEVRGRAGRLDVARHGASPGIGARDALGEDWPRADAPRAAEVAREQSGGRPASRAFRMYSTGNPFSASGVLT